MALNSRHFISLWAIAVGLTCLFQNCGRVNFQSVGAPQLLTGTDTTSGSPTTQLPPPGMVTCEDGSTAPAIIDCPTGVPSPSPSPSPMPSATPKYPDDHGNSGGSESSSVQGLCYLTAGPGSSERIGPDIANMVQVLNTFEDIPHDACMSENACLNLINAYLNETGGELDGKPGTPPASLVSYTSFVDKSNSICAHNPNVQHLTDAQIQNALTNLATIYK